MNLNIKNYCYMNNSETRDWVVYIIQTKSGKLYTGITNDMDRRFALHKKKRGARFFHISGPEKVVYMEPHSNRSDATKREIAIKRMSREQKLAIILVSKKEKKGRHGENTSTCT
jgi:putative endonuclease